MNIKAGDLEGFLSGCFEAARTIVELAKRGYDCILIPCRGAFPVLVGVIEALRSIEGGRGLLGRIYAPYPHPVLGEAHSRSGNFKVLILPFTAHVKLPDEHRKRYGFGENLDVVESSIRRWAARLAMSFRSASG